MPLVVVMDVYVQLVCESVTYVRTYVHTYITTIVLSASIIIMKMRALEWKKVCALFFTTLRTTSFSQLGCPTCCEPGIREPPPLAMVRGLAANVEVLLVQHMRLSFTITDLQLRTSVGTAFAITNICIFIACSVFYSASILPLLHK